MTTEQKALALLNEVQGSTFTSLTRDSSAIEALCRAIEQHEAFRQEVSDAVSKAIRFCKDGRPASAAGAIGAFVIPAPKPDPLVKVLEEVDICAYAEIKAEYADSLRVDLVGRFRASLDALGFEIREKNDG